MTSCKMPLIFFLSINKSFGFLNKIFLLVNDESNFLTKRQLILVMVLIDKFTLFSSLKKETRKYFKVIITGGFSNLFKNSIKTKASYNQDITIKGLIKISKLIK